MRSGGRRRKDKKGTEARKLARKGTLQPKKKRRERERERES